MPTSSRAFLLAARPKGEPKPTDFRLEEVQLDDPADGELLVRNTWMSVDPYMRGRMNDAKSYVPPFELDKPLEGGALGIVAGDAAVLRRRGREGHGRHDATSVRLGATSAAR